MDVIQITTDASFRSETSVAAWAAVIHHEQESYRPIRCFSGIIESNRCGYDANSAEIVGVLQGMYMAFQHFPDISRYHIYCDNEYAVTNITYALAKDTTRTSSFNKRPCDKLILDAIIRFQKKHLLDISVFTIRTQSPYREHFRKHHSVCDVLAGARRLQEESEQGLLGV